MFKMIDLQEETIWINLKTIKTIKPEIQTKYQGSISKDIERAPYTVLDVGGTYTYAIKEPSYEEILRMLGHRDPKTTEPEMAP